MSPTYWNPYIQISVVLLVGIGMLVLAKALFYPNSSGFSGTLRKITSFLIAGLASISMVIFCYLIYVNFPFPANSLGGLALGDTKADVKFKLGEPDDPAKTRDSYALEAWQFGDSRFDGELTVKFAENRVVQIAQVCRNYNQLYGLGCYTTWDEMVSRLGEPSYTSYHAKQTRRIAGYERLRTAFMFNTNQLTAFVIFQDDYGIAYADELPDQQHSESSQ